MVPMASDIHEGMCKVQQVDGATADISIPVDINMATPGKFALCFGADDAMDSGQG
jgi:hypothetical protein